MANGWEKITGDEGLSMEGVHRLRVTIRREQARLRAFRDHVSAREGKQAKRTWRKVMKAAGQVRNLDIAAALLEQAGQGTDRELAERFTRQRERRAKKLTAILEKKPRPMIEWPEGVSPDAPSAQRVLDRFFEAGARAQAEPDHDRLHELRLAGKRLRYLLELTADNLKVKRRLEQLKRLQDALGAMNDCVTVLEMRSNDDFRAWLAEEIERRRKAFERVWNQSFKKPEPWYALMGTHAGGGPGTSEE